MLKFLRIASDLHLEHGVSFLRALPADDRDAQSLLVLAGDVSSSVRQAFDFIASVESRFVSVVYVPGNHEYSGHTLDTYADSVEEARILTPMTRVASRGVTIFQFPGLRLVCGTLWADGLCPEGDAFLARSISDFKRMREWTPARMREVHAEHRRGLTAALETPFDGDTVVVSHHLPSHGLCDPRYGARLNGAFASNCDDLLSGPHAPRLWLFGHTHTTIDRFVGWTRVVCNPLGYPDEINEYGPKFIPVRHFPAAPEPRNMKDLDLRTCGPADLDLRTC